jgi:hypothetical protein
MTTSGEMASGEQASMESSTGLKVIPLIEARGSAVAPVVRLSLITTPSCEMLVRAVAVQPLT